MYRQTTQDMLLVRQATWDMFLVRQTTRDMLLVRQDTRDMPLVQADTQDMLLCKASYPGHVPCKTNYPGHAPCRARYPRHVPCYGKLPGAERYQRQNLTAGMEEPSRSAVCVNYTLCSECVGAEPHQMYSNTGHGAFCRGEHPALVASVHGFQGELTESWTYILVHGLSHVKSLRYASGTLLVPVHIGVHVISSCSNQSTRHWPSEAVLCPRVRLPQL